MDAMERDPNTPVPLDAKAIKKEKKLKPTRGGGGGFAK